MKKVLTLTLLIALIFGMTALNSSEVVAEAEVTLDVAVHPTEFYRESVRAFTGYVESASEGRIEVNTFQFPELGGDDEIVDMISYGEIDMGTALAEGAFASMMPSAQAVNVPFLFSGPESFRKTMESEVGNELKNRMFEESDETVRPLSIMLSSQRHLYSTEGPIRVPSDLEELDITMRVMEAPMHVALWEELGANVVTLPAAERYEALETGMIDATDGSPMSALQAGLLEIQEHATLTGHMFSFASYIINEDMFQGLPEDLQNIIYDGAQLAAVVDNGWIPLSDYHALEDFEDENVQVYQPNTEELAKWREIAAPVGRKFLVEESGVDEDFINDLINKAEEIEAEMESNRDQYLGR